MTKDVVNAILKALPKIEGENARLDELHGIDPTKTWVDLTDKKAWKRAFAENVREQELEARLMTFDEESLLKAETLMYYGRDAGRSKFHEKLAYLRGLGDSKDEIVHTLVEKIPACGRYFKLAQAKLRREGLSLELI